MKLKFEIKFGSDYHIGAGHSDGLADSAVFKGEGGVPEIRGTTLSGLLGQGLWDLLQNGLLRHLRACGCSGIKEKGVRPYCDDQPSCPLCRIMGSPVRSKEWYISTAKLKKPSELKPTRINWRNRVNPRTGTAEHRKLFSQEVVGADAVFEFVVENEVTDLKTIEEAAFIVAGFRMIRNMGGSRRRGKGLCQIRLVEVSPELPEMAGSKHAAPEEVLLDIFRLRWLDGDELKISLPANDLFAKENLPVDTGRKRSFTLVLLAEEPVIIAGKAEAGNSFQSNDYIPGSTLLGALAWKAARKNDLADKEIYDRFCELFLRGGVRVSPLYKAKLVGNDVYPAIPSPLDFLTCKLKPGLEMHGHGAKGYAFVADEPKECAECRSERRVTPLVPLNRYVSLHPKYLVTEVNNVEEMHIAIDPRTGKARSGDLYSYSALAAGQYFIGTIEIEDWHTFAWLLRKEGENREGVSLEFRIGKAAGRGYGLTKVWLSEKEPALTFHGQPLEKRVKDISEPIVMTLLSDAILTDMWGRFYGTFKQEFLEEILGVKVQVINVYARTRSIDGFNSHLGLPRWREIAIVAGSSVGFKIKESMDPAEFVNRLRELEKKGIGFRRAEGFGKLAFNHPIYQQDENLDARLNLPSFLCPEKREEKVENFLEGWQEYLQKYLRQRNFSHEDWGAVARWLLENSSRPVAEVREMLVNFHRPAALTELISKRGPYREKVGIMGEKISYRKKGEEEKMKGSAKKRISEALFEELEKRLEKCDMNKDFLQAEALRMLAEHLGSLQEVKE